MSKSGLLEDARQDSANILLEKKNLDNNFETEKGRVVGKTRVSYGDENSDMNLNSKKLTAARANIKAKEGAKPE